MAIGDALGLPCEGLSPRRAARLFPNLDRYQLLPGRGMCSDDTEHACMTAQALLSAPADPERFRQVLGWQLRFWLLGLPAGVGLATLRGIIKLWLGIRPSGVMSAGNGPAMRALILGVALGHDYDKLNRYVRASTELTHRDDRAVAGALALALAAHLSSQGKRDPDVYLRELKLLCPEYPEFLTLIAGTLSRLNQPLSEVLTWLGCPHGITGYMLHTAPAVLWFWLQPTSDPFQARLATAIRCGGDTDTVAALLGGVLGADLGQQHVPENLLKNLWEWPRSPAWIQALAERLARALIQGPQPSQALNPLALIGRNLVFLLIVLLHGLRRLLPPY